MTWLSLIIAAPFLLCLFAIFVAWAVKRGREIVDPWDDSTEVSPRTSCVSCADIGQEGGCRVCGR